jgi:glycosyltransferase involved in cell wall biosynthesis
VLAPTDAIGAFSDGEFDRIARLLRNDDVSRLHRLRIALPVNRLAATAAMAGLGPFGRYVLFISAFDDDPVTGRCPPHDYLRHMLDHVSIAEVRRNGWVVTSATGRRFDPVWAPTRMNLWRLMARAEATVDLRPPGPIGRETIESLRFGTPVVVPDHSVSAEHARSSNGGLWYRNAGEMVDCVRALLEDGTLRSHLGANGEEWADRHHGDTETFVETTTDLVLGSPPQAVSPVPEQRSA